MIAAGALSAPGESFTVVIDEPAHRTFTLNPPLAADGQYPSGTVVTVSTKPYCGFTLDSGYYSLPGQNATVVPEPSVVWLTGWTRDARDATSLVKVGDPSEVLI